MLNSFYIIALYNGTPSEEWGSDPSFTWWNSNAHFLRECPSLKAMEGGAGGTACRPPVEAMQLYRKEFKRHCIRESKHACITLLF